ncbi:hypothetical protein C8Q76DRAFT_632366 [Earliella scabrosa]|nr:hypothetical protein C8Q76DRAFT_632366 [Earliella scabrosa]
MSARVTRKRARTDEDADAELAPACKPEGEEIRSVEGEVEESACERDGELWLDDGSVIILARNVEFRVYSGPLARHSPVLKELFAKPQSVRRVPSVGGDDISCPVVHLSDSPVDLRHILRAYMPPGDEPYVTSHPSFDVISARIRLGQKYQMSAAYEQSLRFLKKRFTHDFEVWNELNHWVPNGWVDQEAIGVVNLARLIGEPLLLPSALLVCAVLEEEVVHGFTREDGSQENLTLEEIALCIKGRRELQIANAAVVLRTLSAAPSLRCKDLTSCRSSIQKALSGLHLHVDSLVAGSPFRSYLDCVKDGKLGLCSFCSKALSERNSEERLKMWNRLPECFGIEVPGWGPFTEPAAN